MKIPGIFLLCLIPVLSGFSQGVSNPSPVINGPRLINPADYETVRLSKIVKAVRINEKITLDGRLEEAVWKRALPATDFVEQQPHLGEISPERTEVRFLYDEDNLYVGVVLYDSGAPVVTSISYDFQSGESDNVNRHWRNSPVAASGRSARKTAVAGQVERL